MKVEYTELSSKFAIEAGYATPGKLYRNIITGDIVLVAAGLPRNQVIYWDKHNSLVRAADWQNYFSGQKCLVLCNNEEKLTFTQD